MRQNSEATMRVVLLVLALPVLLSSAVAETYQGIGPWDTLGDVKARFPKAKFEKSSPAWAQSTDVMYQVSGRGMSGTIVVNFFDPRPRWKKSLEEFISWEDLEQTQAPSSGFDPAKLESARQEAIQKKIESWEKLIEQPDDEALTVEWVRWVPFLPFPLQRLIAKYGKPEKAGFSDDDFQPYRAWTKKGVVAYLTDDEKKVERIDFNFTPEECRRALGVPSPRR